MRFHSNNHNVTTDERELEQKGRDHRCRQIPNHDIPEQAQNLLVSGVLHTQRIRLVRQPGSRTVRIISHVETQYLASLHNRFEFPET